MDCEQCRSDCMHLPCRKECEMCCGLRGGYCRLTKLCTADYNEFRVTGKVASREKAHEECDVALWRGNNSRKSRQEILAEAHNSLGNVLAAEGDLSLAKDEHTVAIKLSPRYALAFNNRCVDYDELEQFDMAADQCKKA